MNEHNRAASSRFDALASGYDQDRIAPWFRFFQELAISKLDISKGSGFLDVGCGTGLAVREAAKYLKSGQACGIDISPKMIEVAIAQTLRRTNIEFRVGNSEAIPYPNDTFSSVLCTSSLHHYQNPIKSLLEIRALVQEAQFQPIGEITMRGSSRAFYLQSPYWILCGISFQIVCQCGSSYNSSIRGASTSGLCHRRVPSYEDAARP